MTNTFLIILVSLGIKVINESNQPKYYEITYLDGTIENVMKLKKAFDESGFKWYVIAY